ncbi:MAG: hypothetical protein M1839_002081 [Geoglossum umbratile]|nr:MAG: hypothetical protein M1839_002081 [Geoglossum umbratile]
MANATSPLNVNGGSDSTSNRLAMAAAVLAASAFVVAFSQAFLEHINSNSAMRKCTPCAIGYSSRLVKRGWDFHFWKLRAYYPLLNLERGRILNLLFIQSLTSIEVDDDVGKIEELNKRWGWKNIDEGDSPERLQIADDMAVLCDIDTDRIISISDVPWRHWKLRLAFLKWRWRHPLQPNRRPRASWAQLLFAFGIRETHLLKIRLTDADMIPSNLDVPLQRIGLFDLGVLAFLMGFTSVKIDIPNRDFRALSPFGTISTQELQGWGKIIHFDGDAREFHKLSVRCSEVWLFRGSMLINGSTSYGKYSGNSLSLAVDILGESIKTKRSRDDHLKKVQERNADGVLDHGRIERDNTWEEASLMTRLVDNLVSSLLQQADQAALPKVKVSSDIHGFDGRKGDTGNTLRGLILEASSERQGARELLRKSILEDRSQYYEDALKDIFSAWQATTGKYIPSLLLSASFMTVHGIACGFPTTVLLEPILAWSRYRAEKLWARRPFSVSDNVRRSMALSLGSFFRKTSDYLMSRELGASPAGLYGWGISTMKVFYDHFPKESQLEIVSSEGCAAAVLIAETSALIEDFNPREWAARVRQSQVESFSVTLFKPLNVLWCQILILDIAIQYHIRRGWDVKSEAEPAPQSAPPPNSRAVVLSEALTAATSPSPDLPPGAGRTLQHRATTLSEVMAANPPQADPSGGPVEDGPAEPRETQEPENLLSRLLSELLYCDEWHDREGEVAYAISRSSEIPDNSSDSKPFHEWDLKSSLEEHSGITTEANGDKLRENYFQVLADLLELRGLFVIAFLGIHPDSTDVYLAETENIQMPIA